MTVLNPFAISPGEQRTATLIVRGPDPLSPTQFAEAKAMYERFRLEAGVSVCGYLVRDWITPSGMPVRLISNNGQDYIVAEPPPPRGSKTKLPHGFAVVTNWRAPFIFKYAPADALWALAGEAVPQIPSGSSEVKGYSQVVRDDPDHLVYPAVYSSDVRKLWDFGPHSAPSLTNTYVVPANLEFPVDGVATFAPLRPHYLIDYSIRAPSSATPLYEMPPPSAVLVAAESIVPLPGAVDGKGMRIALQMFRHGQTSLVGNLWKHRFCNEILQRATATTYTLVERNTVDVNTPITPGFTNTTDEELVNSLGLSLPVSLFKVEFFFEGGATIFGPPFVEGGPNDGGIPVEGTNPHYTGAYGALTITTSLDESATVTESSFQKTVVKVANADTTIDKLVALPAIGGVDYARLQVALHFPATQYWRGGWKQWAGGGLAPTQRGYQRILSRLEYIDADHHVSAAPLARLNLNWANVVLLEGTVTGDLHGKSHAMVTDNRKQGGEIKSYWRIIAGPAPSGTPRDTYNAWVAATDVLTTEWEPAWSAFNIVADPPVSEGAFTFLEDRQVTDSDALILTGSYSYTSRYIIDYDHRGRFYAAIRVEVNCSGAAWEQASGGYAGQLAVTSDPTYDVEIYFECNWNGATSSQLLASGSASHPAFEFLQLFAPVNVYEYPSDIDGHDFIYWMPPELSLPEQPVQGLVTLAKHQGVNPCLVAADVRADLADIFRSAKGIEHTDLEIDGSGNITAQKLRKYVQGQLYARTFKLADFDDALWMLRALRVDAKANAGDSGPDWYYFSALKGTIQNTSFHIEVRNGVIERWSDEIPAPGDAVRPAAADRIIKLYEV